MGESSNTWINLKRDTEVKKKKKVKNHNIKMDFIHVHKSTVEILTVKGSNWRYEDH